MNSQFTFGGRRWGRGVAVLVVTGFAVISLLPVGWMPRGGESPSIPTGAPLDFTHAGPVGSPFGTNAPLALAERTLARGAGPDALAPMVCQTTADGWSATCSVEPQYRSAKSATLTNVSESPVWMEVSPHGGPTARVYTMMTYDPADGYVLLFGGFNRTTSQPGDDTWKYAENTWTQLFPPVYPTPRYSAAMAYDSADGYVVLFGGWILNGGTPVATAQTWTFAGGTWAELAPATSPSPRVGQGMAYDSADGYLLLFGGYSGTAFLNDTWAFHGGDWKNLSPPVSPPVRQQAFMAYDAHDGYVLLYGGQVGSQELSDTWAYLAGGWTMLHPSINPNVESTGAMEYDPYTGNVVLFGGLNTSATSNETWTYSDGTWSELVTQVSPSARANAILVDDARDGYLVTFGGGIPPGDDADTWAWEAPSLQGQANSSSVDVGQTINFSVTARSPAGAVSYAWEESSSLLGCAGAQVGLLTCHPTSEGNYTVQVNVTDGVGARSVGELGVEVYAAPAAPTVAVTRATLDVGQAVGFSASTYGGSGSYVWTWIGLPGTCNGSSAALVQCRPSVPGNDTVWATVTDSNGFSTRSSPVTVAVTSLPTVVVAATPSSVVEGNSVSIHATVSGGYGVETFTWSGLPAGCTAPNGPSLTCSPSVAGTYHVNVVATDQNGGSGLATDMVNVTAPAGPSSWTPLVIGIVAGVLVILVVVVLLIRRHQGKTATRSKEVVPPSSEAPSPPTSLP